MNCIQVCLLLAASCAMSASADPTSYKFGYSANNLQETVELDAAPALGSIKDCDPLTSGYMVSSTPAPVMRSAVEIEPASIMSVTASPILSTVSEVVSVSTPAPILRTAIDIEPARIINAAPMKLETRIATSPLLKAFRPALATFDSDAWQASLENASTAPIPLKTITKTAKVGSTIISSGLEAMPAVRTQYASVTAAPLVESKIVKMAPIVKTLSTEILPLPLPSVSSSYSYVPQTYASSYLNSYTAPQYYSMASKFLAAPQYYYPSAAYFAPRYYSSAASFAPQYYSAAPKYYSSVSVAADEPCDK